MSTVVLERIEKRFGSVAALDDVSLDIADGELLTILGPSGCGKTTLLRIVAGLEQPSAGRILFAERDVTSLSAQQRSIGMVFQSYALFPNLSVRQNIAFPLEVRGTARKVTGQRVDELLAIVNLHPEADRYPHEISGGQAQRCALARALAPQPDVLLLDEPLSALDVVVRVRLRDEIRRIQKQVGTTTLYVTHDQSEALALGDRVAVMNFGRVEQVGSPGDVYARPATPFCATFVGSRSALLLPVMGGRVTLGPGLDVGVGEIATPSAQVFVAPEDVEIVAVGDGATPATIVGRTFHGPTTRLQLEAQMGEQSFALNADLGSRDAVQYVNGQTVGFRVPDQTVVCYPADADA